MGLKTLFQCQIWQVTKEGSLQAERILFGIFSFHQI